MKDPMWEREHPYSGEFGKEDARVAVLVRAIVETTLDQLMERLEAFHGKRWFGSRDLVAVHESVRQTRAILPMTVREALVKLNKQRKGW